ncbi:MAG TPA: hypothetical protein VFJ76_08375 [Solirubrobacterales bacterium]|nr:hypothetical protein [Solirubrobacterales bacterium]
MSSIAVFLVIGGATAFAALGKNTVGSKQLKKNAVTAAKIKNNAVTTPKLKNGAVTAEKLAPGAVTIGAGSVTTDKLANGAVTNEKLGSSSVNSGKLANGSVTNEKLANGAVTSDKIAAGGVSRSNLAEGVLLPKAFALVEFDGTVDTDFTQGGITNATVEGGSYCFDTPFPVLHAQATGEADGEGNDFPSVLIAGAEESFEECPPGTDVEVEMWDSGLDEATEEEFFLVLW